MAMADPAQLARGVVTASVGNMALGVAWNARRFGVPCQVVISGGNLGKDRLVKILRGDSVVVSRG
jgi:threonine dehydratase